MTTRNSQNLTKPMLLAMCRHWGYKSNLWVARGSKQRARQAEGSPVVALPAVASPATPVPPVVADADDGAMRAACQDAGAASALLERLSAKAITAVQLVAGRNVRALAQADTAAAAFYTRTFKVGRFFIERALQWARDFVAAAHEKLVVLAWQLHDGDVLDEVAAEFEHICSVLRRHCDRKQVAIRRVDLLPFLPEPTLVTLSEMNEFMQAYQEFLTGLEGFSSMAQRECSDDTLRVTLASLINLLMTQLSLLLHAFDKRHQFYMAMLDQEPAGPDARVGCLFARFADQFSHHLQPVLTSLPAVGDLQHSSPACAGGGLRDQCEQHA